MPPGWNRGRIRAQMEWSHRDVMIDYRDIQREVVSVELHAPGIVAARFAEDVQEVKLGAIVSLRGLRYRPQEFIHDAHDDLSLVISLARHHGLDQAVRRGALLRIEVAHFEALPRMD